MNNNENITEEKKMIRYSPPMAVNISSASREKLNSRTILDVADFMVKNGLVDAGYNIINIGDAWMAKVRNPDTGSIMCNKEKMGCSLQELTDELNTRGIGLGIVTGAGTRTPEGYPGSFEHEYADAEYFTNEGVAMICHDFSNLPRLVDTVTLIRRMSMALRAAGDKIYYSIFTPDDLFVQRIRTTGADSYHGRPYLESKNVMLPPPETNGRSGPGCLFDCGQLRIGHKKDARSVKRELITVVMASSPLTLRCDPSQLHPEILNIVKNPGAISVLNDPEVRPARIMNAEDGQVFFKVLDDGKYALALINDTERYMEVPFYAHDMGLTSDARMVLKAIDVFGGEIVYSEDHIAPDLEPGDSRLYILELVERKETTGK